MVWEASFACSDRLDASMEQDRQEPSIRRVYGSGQHSWDLCVLRGHT